MKIKNHDDFPKLDHRTAPSFWAEQDWVIDSPPIPRARPGTGDTINWGIFKRHFWGELLRHQQSPIARGACQVPALCSAGGGDGGMLDEICLADPSFCWGFEGCFVRLLAGERPTPVRE